MTAEERAYGLGLLKSADDLLTQRERFLIDTIADLESRLAAATERGKIIEEMYNQEYGLEHATIAARKEREKLIEAAAYERGKRDVCTYLEVQINLHVVALKDRGAKGDGE